MMAAEKPPLADANMIDRLLYEGVRSFCAAKAGQYGDECILMLARRDDWAARTRAESAAHYARRWQATETVPHWQYNGPERLLAILETWMQRLTDSEAQQ